MTPLHASKSIGYGVERYAFEILQHLIKADVPVKAIGVSERFRKAESLAIVRTLGVTYEWFELIKNMKEFGIIHHAEPVLATLGFLIRGARPIVTTVHEVPDIVSHGSSVVSGLQILKLACKNSNLLIADSKITRDDLIKKLGVKPQKIRVVNLGVDESFRPMKRKEPKAVKTIGYVGALSPKKNIHALIDAFKILKSKQTSFRVCLELWGRIGKHGEEIMQHVKGLGVKDVYFKGFADEKHLPSIYNSFDLFVYPSLKEGFGLPILEAKRCGIPTIVVMGAAIPEEVRAHSLLADDSEDMANHMDAVLSGSSYISPIVEDAIQYSKNFSWDRTVKGTLQAYRSIGYNQR